MQRLTSQGQEIVDDLARRHGFSADAVTHMLYAVSGGNGAMAMFDHREFGGAGQWMRGGMLLLSDMFNHELRARVDALCHDIGDSLASQPGLFASDPSEHWWPAGLGAPSATGSQNDTRYAYFAEAQRLAVQTGDGVRVYDTRDHRIGGISQQQGAGSSLTFTSQYGAVDLASLPLVAHDGQAPCVASAPAQAADPGAAGHEPAVDLFAAIERLGDLKAKGLLTEEEFAAKKAELLSRL